MAQEARSEVLILMNKKAKIEDEIKQLGTILAKNGVGLSEPLVDDEGFPLATVDIYQVRHARSRIICLQNDHKALMKEIEKGLSKYYGSNINLTENTQSESSRATPPPNIELPVFAKILNVLQGSPADEAGLKNNDEVTQFGSVNTDNFKDVSTIGTIVQHCQDSEIKIRIRRGSAFINIKLRPHKWNGRGLLGCNIAPLDQVDR